MHIFTPDPQSETVALIAKKLGVANTAVAVPCVPVAGARELYCFFNVRDITAERGGELVNGWLVWQHDDLFVEAEHHAIWRKPTGELVCVTPQTPPEKTITFIPDPSAVYDFETGMQENNIRIALVKDSRLRLLERYFKVFEEETDLKNSGRRLVGNVVMVELTGWNLQRFEELEIEKSNLFTEILMWGIGRNDPCPCGSGKKYKKCHGASL
jgi:hypothetical protein